VPAGPQRRADLLTQIDPDLLVLFRETVHLVAEVPMRVASVGADVAGSPRLETLAASQLSEPMGSQARLDDLAVIITSGRTTAVPKGSWRTFAAYTAMVRGRARLIGANSSTARSPISRKFCSTRQ
jgi:fatty-acyl-CoA synthase